MEKLLLIKEQQISQLLLCFDPYIINAINAIMPSINAAAYYMVNYNPYLYDNDPANDTTTFYPSTSAEETVLQTSYNFVGSNYLNELSNTYQSFADQSSASYCQ